MGDRAIGLNPAGTRPPVPAAGSKRVFPKVVEALRGSEWFRQWGILSIITPYIVKRGGAE